MGDEPADAGFPAGNEASAAISARLGQYRLERRLGGGGMAVVYLARDDRLDRPVALKVLAPVLAEDEEFRKRFIRESRAAAAVEDPHIIPVFEAGEAGGMLYIAMRYVPGGDVRTMVRRDGPLPPGRAAAVIAQVASALDAAHAAGLVHRDVKPANMLVDRRSNRSDHVYLADFGLSKKRLTASAGLTGTGQFVGTLDYSAPEQIRGRPADGRTDQYALACAAFELLTGAPPFHNEEATAVMYAHLSELPPPVTSRRAGLPPAVDQVVARALAKDPADRYASCQEFAEALLQALGTPLPIDPVSDDLPAAADPAAPVSETAPAPADPPTGRAAAGPGAGSNGIATPGRHARDDHQRLLELGPVRRSTRFSPSRVKPSRSRVLLLTVASAAIIAAIATALSVSLSGGRSAPSRHGATAPGHSATAPGHGATAPGPGGAPLTGTLMATLGNPGSSAHGVAFGPDAKTLAVASINNGAGGATHVWDIATGKVTATLTAPGSEGVDYVAYGPGGTTLAAADYNFSTYVWDIATGKVTATLTDPHSKGVDSVAFAPDGTTLASADPDGNIYLWDIATKKMTATLTDPGGRAVNGVAFAPDGTTVAAADDNGSIYLWDIATQKVTAILTAPGSGAVDSVAYAPDGTTLAAANFNGSTYLWNIAARKVTATLKDPGSNGVDYAAYAPDGTTLATADSNGNTYLWDIEAKARTATLHDPDGDGVYYVAFAPDGTTLAAADGNGSVYLWKLQTVN